ncbi:MAG: aminopeptidase P N-terminal domain-containing protein [SAR324 cluster bacterium]|nr:aminopeptidase P N-terminal domain-containing protein [SAR324 cluster bacterium]
MNRETLLGKKFHLKKRKALWDAMKPDSLALICSAEIPADPYARVKHRNWPQNSEFYYLTGISQPKCSLLLIKSKSYDRLEILFIPAIDKHFIRWEGAMLKTTDASNLSGIEDIQYNHNLDTTLNNLLPKLTHFYIATTASTMDQGKSAYELKIADIKKYFWGLKMMKIGDILDKLRWVKEDCEIDNIKKAIAITAKGIKRVAKRIAAGIYEHQLVADLTYEYLNAGCLGHAFYPIVGAGINSTVLHYASAADKLVENDVLLIDTGAEWGGYAADVTRVFPVGKNFTNQAADIYALNLTIQKTILANLKIGQSFAKISQLAQEIQTKLLIENKLIKSPIEAKECTIHNIGHPLGLDVHDPPLFDEPLVPGSVITIEPGLYFPIKKIGVRIEDDILFTAKGIVNLTKDIPK